MCSRANLNNNDVVVAVTTIRDGPNDHALWSYAINDSNVAAGALYDYTDQASHSIARATLSQVGKNGILNPQYNPTQIWDVTYIDPPPASGADFGGRHASDAFGINNAGHAVGDKYSGGSRRAFGYFGAALVDLGTLGGDNSTAIDINSKDQIVGTAQTKEGTYHAFIWERGVMADLNDRLPANSGWVLEAANALNDRGDIVGVGTLDGVQHAFLMHPDNAPPRLAARYDAVSGKIEIVLWGTFQSTYRIEHRSDPGSGDWTPAGTVVVTNDGQVVGTENAGGAQHRFYRAVLLPP